MAPGETVYVPGREKAPAPGSRDHHTTKLRNIFANRYEMLLKQPQSTFYRYKCDMFSRAVLIPKKQRNAQGQKKKNQSKTV